MDKLRKGGFLVSRIHQLSGRIFTKKLKEYSIEEINPAQGRILFALWEGGSMPILELARKTSLGKSTLTSMLDRLEQSGHLKRVPDKKDRRQIMVRLTEKYKVLQGKYEQVSNEMLELYYKGFCAEEIDRFESYLDRILQNLEQYERDIYGRG